MDFRAKGNSAPPGYHPWFELRRNDEATLICGHWSALGLRLAPRLAALDSGCVWGGKLTALRLEDRTLYQVPCRGYQAAGE
jgi:bis(5'-nucleosyl)-tetraphosphatase (symmetrical)